MNIEVVPASLFDANCYVLWPAGGSEALIVDPGPGTSEGVAQVLQREGLRVGAVLLTHGHVDHVWEAHRVCAGAPVFIPEPDMPMMDDPEGALAMRVGSLGLGPWERPEDLRGVGAGMLSPAEGITLRVVPAPGHSPGSSIFLVAPTQPDEVLALSGDVIFAGSVGRSDLPGGDEGVMNETLRTLADALDPATVLLPGHGPQTRWGTELQSNLFVARARRRQ